MAEKPLKVALNEPTPQLNGFQIEKRLGSGTYASVYKAISKVHTHTFGFPRFT